MIRITGLGLDGKDGHVRITKAGDIKLYGGSKETHEIMQETAIKFNEELSKRGKNTNTIHHKEVIEILHKVID